MSRVNRRIKDEYSFPENFWYRYSAYQIEGRHVVPAPDADRIEYDPWDAYRAIAEVRRTVRTPYSSFLELGRRLSLVAPAGVPEALSPELRNEIADWCREWGYPGILPSILTELTLEIVPGATNKTWSQDRYYRLGGGWGETNDRWRRLGERPVLPRPAETEEPKPGAILWRWSDRRYVRKSLKSLARYFPTAAGSERNFPYPAPDSDQFRKLYAEPVEDFVAFCVRFRQAAEVISRHLAGVSPLIENMREDPDFVLNESMAFLSSLEAGIGPLHRLEEDRLFVRTESLSLLSSYARMVFLDLARGRRIIRCGRHSCDRIFVSDEPRARYCTPECRNLELNARYRKSHERRRAPRMPKHLVPRRRPGT